MEKSLLRHTLKAVCLLVCLSGASGAAEPRFTNPILAGSYPDPSICRDGDSYYLVNSSFEYFPGLPIHRSKDLVNWELVGYGLHRPEQVSAAVNLLDVQSDGGIHAPSIRCQAGMFYIVTTNVYQPPGKDRATEFVNFVITADNIEGPWSMPKVLEGAPGIDPDLFFDEDGRVWYVGTHSPDNAAFPGEGEIWLQQVDTDAWRLTGQRHFLWRGACGGVWAEGPHLYKKGGRYYLLVAEGGTSFNHAVVVASSKEITGPYLSNPRNPILSARHLSYDYWVNSTGHADLVQLTDGRWYMVTLGIRGDLKRRSNMGRETHLVPVQWETEPFWWKEERIDWPVAAPLTGRIERHNPMPFAGTRQYRQASFHDGFDAADLKLDWNFRRLPTPDAYSLSARRGFLRLYARPGAIAERARASLPGIRQTESDFVFSAMMHFSPSSENAEAGVNLFQKDNNYLSFTVIRRRGQPILRAVLATTESNPKRSQEIVELKAQPLLDFTGTIALRVVSKDDRYTLEYSLDDSGGFQAFVATRADQLLSRGYTGAYLGLYATGNGQQTADHADFDHVSYTAFER